MKEDHKAIMRNVNRAKAYVAKFDAIRAIPALIEALRKLIKTKNLFGRERFEVEIMLNEVMRNLSQMPEMKSIFPKGLTYKKGQEKTLHAMLTKVYEKINEAIERAEAEKIRKRKNEIDRYILQGQKLLDEKNYIEAKKVFRKAVELFSDQPGINVDAGARMLKAGQAQDAIDFLLKGIEQDSRDNRPYGYLVVAYEKIGELEKAEEACKNAFRNFGPNERLFVRMANLYIKMRRWDDAYDTAQSALEINPTSPEALKVVAQVKPRIFGRTAT